MSVIGNPYESLNSQTTGAVAAASSKKNSGYLGGTSASDIQETFLKLFVAQLKNQDPSNPMDNSQITTQMSQISQVGGIQQLNQTMMSLIGAQAASQSLMAASMINKNVLVEGNEIELATEGGTGKAGVLLDGPVKGATVKVTDAQGNVVKTIALDEPSMGMNTFEWDGKKEDGTPAAAGKYTFSVELNQAEGSKTKAIAYGLQSVTAVAWDKGIPELILSNGKRVELGDVAQMMA